MATKLNLVWTWIEFTSGEYFLSKLIVDFHQYSWTLSQILYINTLWFSIYFNIFRCMDYWSKNNSLCKGSLILYKMHLFSKSIIVLFIILNILWFMILIIIFFTYSDVFYVKTSLTLKFFSPIPSHFIYDIIYWYLFIYINFRCVTPYF